MNNFIFKSHSISKSEGLITPAQLYLLLNKNGEEIKLKQVYKMIKTKNFPMLRMCGRYYIVKKELTEWLTSNTNRQMS
ncbi:MAG: hypothetical protein WCF96_09945 [Eubacteriales bacterium]